MTAGAKGIDVSSWQHPAGEPIDWHAVRDSGVTFAMLKATQGGFYRNPWFIRDSEDAFAAGLLVGAYHFFDGSVSPAEQAGNFKGTIAGQPLDLGCWLDFEIAPSAQWTLAAYVNGFMEACKPERQGIGLYCGLPMWEELKGASVAPAALWLSGEGFNVPATGAVLWTQGPKDCPGVPASADLVWLQSARGINLPSSPAPRPSASSVHPPEPIGEPDEETGPPSATE